MYRLIKNPIQKLYFKTCPVCAGTGYSFGGQCERCEGTGKIGN
jgi:DnaJ-class molecular chaperone